MIELCHLWHKAICESLQSPAPPSDPSTNVSDSYQNMPLYESFSYLLTYLLLSVVAFVVGSWGNDRSVDHHELRPSVGTVSKSDEISSQTNSYVANMLQANERRMMTETSLECSVYAMPNSSVFSMIRRNKLASWVERQSNDSELQTEGVLRSL